MGAKVGKMISSWKRKNSKYDGKYAFSEDEGTPNRITFSEVMLVLLSVWDVLWIRMQVHLCEYGKVGKMLHGCSPNDLFIQNDLKSFNIPAYMMKG